MHELYEASSRIQIEGSTRAKKVVLLEERELIELDIFIWILAKCNLQSYVSGEAKVDDSLFSIAHWEKAV